MVSSILNDPKARWYNNEGFVVNGVWTATKTGTTTTSNSSEVKDVLFESYSPVVSTFAWNGNHDGSGLTSTTYDPIRFAVNSYMERVHKEVYQPAGKWQPGQKIEQPSGIQTLTVNGRTDIWPSWYNSKSSGVTTEKLKFNKFNKKLASSCTPQNQIIEIDVTKTTDPLTKNVVYTVPDGYDRNTSDTCEDYSKPSITSFSSSSTGVTATIKASLGYTYSITVDGQTVIADAAGSGGSINLSLSDLRIDPDKTDTYTIVLTVTDESGEQVTSNPVPLSVQGKGTTNKDDNSSSTNSSSTNSNKHH